MCRSVCRHQPRQCCILSQIQRSHQSNCPLCPGRRAKHCIVLSSVLTTTFLRLIFSTKYLILNWRRSSSRLCLNSLVIQKLNFDNNVQLSLTLAALSLGLWWTFDRSRSGFGLGITTAFVATVFTQLLVYNGVYQWVSDLIVSLCWSWPFVNENNCRLRSLVTTF